MARPTIELKDQFANNYFPEEAATRYVATAAAAAPFEELKKCCLFQLADEQRHLEMDRGVFEAAGIPERDWLPAWEQPGTTCRFLRRAWWEGFLASYDKIATPLGLRPTPISI